MRSREFRRGQAFAFIIFLIGLFSLPSQHLFSLTQAIVHPPNSSQQPGDSSSPILTCLVNTDIEAYVGDNVWFNWSVENGAGETFFVEQIAGNVPVVINFGILQENFEIVSSLANTTEAGSYTILFHVYNSTSTSQDSAHLTVSEKEVFSLPVTLIWVAGSVAVVVDTTAVIYRVKISKGKKPRDEESDHLSTLSISPSFLTEEDYVFLSSTHISHMFFLRASPLEITHNEAFKDIGSNETISELVLKLIAGGKKGESFFNAKTEMPNSIVFATLISFPVVNLLLCILSEIGLDAVFINSIGLTSKKLLQDNKTFIQHPDMWSRVLVEDLHLERSRTYDLPTATKVSVLQYSPVWQSSLDAANLLNGDQVNQIDIDLEEMNLGQLLEMGEFMEEVRGEMTQSNKESNGTDFPDE